MPSEGRTRRDGKGTSSFQTLESLRLLCRQVEQDQADSLEYFEHGVGYQHVRGNNRISVSSSATCVLSLVATGLWADRHSRTDTKFLLKELISKDTSAGLEPDNPFTTAWILEAVSTLEKYSDALDPADLDRIANKQQVLLNAIDSGNGGVSIAPYPASPYLTQLVVRVLRRTNKLPATQSRKNQ